MLKNEGAVVERMLNGCFDSLKDSSLKIVALCITDTGSTDDTIAKAKKWSETNNISCRIISESWVNFGVNRTNSLLNAKMMFPDVDYYLLVDGDMVLKVKDKSQLDKKLNCNSYIVEQKNHGSSYYNARLLSSNAVHRCVGGTHEYWSDIHCPGRDQFNGVYYEDHNDGGSRADKYDRDLKILLQGMRSGITPDYLMGRYMYYLGQSYQGKNEHDKSDYWLKRKVEVGGWDEEVFYSLYQTAENMYRRGGRFIEKSIMLYLKAWNNRPTRAEPLYGAARAARISGFKELAKQFISIGVQIPRPKDILFINEGVYDGRLFNEEKSKL
jgi:glycosyltransferase involved in cell wall biosynthesis